MKTKIVIADDHPIVLAGIADMINRDGRFALVGKAQDPTSLVELVERHDPEIVVTDYSMPSEGHLSDGIRLISYLKHNFPEVRILVLTMVSNRSIVAEMYRAGVCGVIPKSCGLKELSIALTTALARRTYRWPGLPREEAIPDPGGVASVATLSPRELEVIQRFTSGQGVSEIASSLNRSVKTVSTQKTSAMSKLGTRTDQELVEFSILFGLSD